MHKCDTCNKIFKSNTCKLIHIREKHTFKKCTFKQCKFCEKNFYSANNIYLKCEECRGLQAQLNTNDLTSNTYIYNDNKRYYLYRGEIKQVCPEYRCINDISCEKHKAITFCKGCNNGFEKNGFNFCTNCRNKNDKSKNKSRYKLYQLKTKLGGVCVQCKDNDMFKLEFDHINPKIKTGQITRMNPLNWDNELNNIQLLCGNCHRLKSLKDNLKVNDINKYTKFKNNRKNIVQNIKKEIGKCQNCQWSCEDKEELSYVLDFDHIYENKIKQISDLYSFKIETLLQEISKCRLLCRNCHQLRTCLQKNQKILNIYYSEEQINKFKSILNDASLMKINNQEVLTILKKNFSF